MCACDEMRSRKWHAVDILLHSTSARQASGGVKGREDEKQMRGYNGISACNVIEATLNILMCISEEKQAGTQALRPALDVGRYPGYVFPQHFNTKPGQAIESS